MDDKFKNSFKPQEIEAKWQDKWESDKTFSPDVENAQNPYFNLMMFPYPSAEGLHVGNMYAFTGADVYARYNRMLGKDVLEPIGLDGFGIHSENYALKVGRHPIEQAQIAEKNFYRQLRSIGNSFDWQRTVETYDPGYYKWTQWIFIQLFKAGLAYRKTALVNWCPKDMTVLSDEQVIDGLCERCSEKVEKRNLEQWFFRITNYADRLLNNIESLKWTEKVKVAQRNWIGKSEGAEVSFELGQSDMKKPNYLILHGFTGHSDKNFIPWLKNELEERGFSVQAPQLPNTDSPKETVQVSFVIDNCSIDENTVIIGHSLGGAVAMKVIEKINQPIKGLHLVAPAVEPAYRTGEPRAFWDTFKLEYDYEAIIRNTGFRTVISDLKEKEKRQSYLQYLAEKIKAEFIEGSAEKTHFVADSEPLILDTVIPSVKVFTTRPDTLFGATFMVLSPEHELVASLLSSKFRIQNSHLDEVKKYVEAAKGKTEIERTSEGKEKTGVFSGLYAINPVNGKQIPIWIADYVLAGYGTGAIMAVPAHDTRDFEFAKKYNLPIVQVIENKNEAGMDLIQAYTGSGKLFNSGDWNGIDVPKEMGKVLESIEKDGIGTRRANYHLRDWLISRQRYWGPPIPMIFCSTCAKNGKAEVEGMAGWFPVPDEQLPVLLPDVADWKPMGTGKSPLDNHPEFHKTTCPECGGEAKRETDVSDTFLDSSWYFLRYPSTDIESGAFDIERTKKWLPVHQYIGGAEHSVLHLLYSRFVTMVLHDLNFIDFEEPFSNFFAHGLIIKDGAKMSKSKGNVVVPDEYIAKYGADTLRSYLMFIGQFSDGGDFRDSGIEGMYKFLKKVWRLISIDCIDNKWMTGENNPNFDLITHRTIKKVTRDIENFSYNTAIASLMEFYNEVTKGTDEFLGKKQVEAFLKLLAPFAPHMTEELWAKLSNSGSIHTSAWPEFEESLTVGQTIIIPVQINGKRRGEIEVKASQFEVRSEIEDLAREAVVKQLEGFEVKKVIYVSGKIVNFVV